jgi:hypothetical protein
MPIHVNDGNAYKIPKAIYVWNANANVWSETKSVNLCTTGNVWKTLHNTAVINSNVTNANLYTIMGSPTYPLNVKVTINTNVTINSVNSNVASFNISSFPAGSRIYLINRGTIVGGTGNAGSDGGNAISTGSPLIINNLGLIQGGTAGNGAVVGYYLSGSTITTFENSGSLLGRVG